MAYISVLVPAFYTKEIDENEIVKTKIKIRLKCVQHNSKSLLTNLN